jgi:hypothetical protein
MNPDQASTDPRVRFDVSFCLRPNPEDLRIHDMYPVDLAG